jgi:hypothetical protein
LKTAIRCFDSNSRAILPCAETGREVFTQAFSEATETSYHGKMNWQFNLNQLKIRT